MHAYIPRIVIRRVGEPSPSYHSQLSKADSPDKVVTFWREIIAAQADHEPDKEHLVALLANTRYRVTGYHIVAIGTLNECTAHPREILRAAVVAGAYAIVLVHNHPSGDPSPSEADRRLTRRVADSADLLQIRLIDHVVVGDPADISQGYYSFKEHGLL